MSRRRVLVTGGEGRLGSAIAAEWREAGAEVDAPGRGGLDVSCEASVSEWFAGRRAYDVLACCAAVAGEGLLVRLEARMLEKVVETNLTGAWRCCRHFEKARGGSMAGSMVLLFGSQAGNTGMAGLAAYGASKAGLLGLVRTLAREWGPGGGRINLILPGWMESPMTGGVSEAKREEIRLAHALPNFSRPEEVAAFCRMLDRMPAVSGQVFQLDSRPGSA